ncbi:MAG: hypothetical protein NDJ92_20030 [Thermoanaerobaculia bacterium]|nr:hypothetical protein [Thermoanaerobaculia bacterium]
MPEFSEARWRAFLQDLISGIRGEPADLLSFEEVRERLGLRHVVDRGMHDVPLESIVGTLGREREFNRYFFPRTDSLRGRWDDVRGLAEGPEGFPPVELYRVGDVYFVVDGHHRVSVAQSIGSPAIEAHVREFVSDVTFGPGDSIGDVILRSGFEDFVESTCLSRDDAEQFRVSAPEGYSKLLDHISVHRYYRGVELGREPEWCEAIDSWRARVYDPMVAVIRESAILGQFPGRTETDLYLFAMDHLHYMREETEGAGAAPGEAVARMKAETPRSSIMKRLLSRFREFVSQRRG